MKGNITREEAEKRILLAMEDIWSDYLEYNPNAHSLTLFFSQHDNEHHFSAYNACWPEMDGDPAGEDYETPLKFFKIVKEEE